MYLYTTYTYMYMHMYMYIHDFINDHNSLGCKQLYVYTCTYITQAYIKVTQWIAHVQCVYMYMYIPANMRNLAVSGGRCE